MTSHIVIYIDGSSRPNPGKSGWGAHGFKYEQLSSVPKKLNDLYLTPEGYLYKHEIENRKNSSNPITEYSDVIEFYDFCVHEEECDNNNSAELYAFYRILDYFKDHSLKSLRIFTDSEYVRRGTTDYLDIWKKNNWRRQDNQLIMLSHIWERIYDYRQHYESKSIQLDIHWVKGHSDTYGNIIADRLAAIAALKGHNDPSYKDYQVQPAALYRKQDIDRHPFICFKRMYFSSAQSMPDAGRYFIAEPGGDDSDFGRKTALSSYAVIINSTPDPVLEIIKEKQRKCSQDFVKTIMVRLDRLYDRSVYPYIEYYGEESLISSNGYTNNLDFVDGKNITFEMTPPGLTPKGLEVFDWLSFILKQYIEKNISKDLHVTDITDHFYTKGVLKPEYNVGFRDTSVTVNNIKVPLLLGGDLLPRNNLKRLEGKNPKITLVLWSESLRVFQYACIIEVDDAVGIWSNYHSRRVFDLS